MIRPLLSKTLDVLGVLFGAALCVSCIDRPLPTTGESPTDAGQDTASVDVAIEGTEQWASIPGLAIAARSVEDGLLAIDEERTVWAVSKTKVARFGSAPGFDPGRSPLIVKYGTLLYGEGPNLRDARDGHVAATAYGEIVGLSDYPCPGCKDDVYAATNVGELVHLSSKAAPEVLDTGLVGGLGCNARGDGIYAKRLGDLTEYHLLSSSTLQPNTVIFTGFEVLPSRYVGPIPVLVTGELLLRAPFSFTASFGFFRLDSTSPLALADYGDSAVAYALPRGRTRGSQVLALARTYVTTSTTAERFTLAWTRDPVRVLGQTGRGSVYWMTEDGNATKVFATRPPGPSELWPPVGSWRP